ncbi:MAG: radical SAM family heme chaperone HemW [Clostridia bacterium]|nr:radical SAM family heme chaperone HemW [Clostridia bacterium]
MDTIGLYIHIPFCAKKCNYCDFYSMNATEAHYSEYINTLIKSFAFWSGKLKNRKVDTVYIGGGTPSLLGTDRLLVLLDSIYSCFNVTSGAEITIEVNPNSTDSLAFSSLKNSGVNRISIGLQSANDDELRILGRLHTLADVCSSIDSIKKAGIDNYSLDVMMGIPLQTMDSLNRTLEFCVNAETKHISTYILKIEKNTLFYKNSDKYVFADEDTQADMYEHTCKFLSQNGFRHYEISNFCIDDKISKHNMKYWSLDDYVGIGPSAHSMLNGKRFYYPKSIQEFKDNKFIFESEGKTPEEYLMLSLRTDLGFDFKKCKELFGLSVTDELLSEAKKLEKLGLLRILNDSIILTEQGFLVSNSVIGLLLSKGIG